MQPFQKISTKDWENKARADLKTSESLSELTRSWGDLEIRPYYGPDDRSGSLTPFANRYASGSSKTSEARRWLNIPEIGVTDDARANSLALSELMGGADGIHFHARPETDFHVLLQDILPEYAFISISAENIETADRLRTFLDEGNYNHKYVQGSVYHQMREDDRLHCLRLFDAWPGIRVLPITMNETERDEPVEQIFRVAVQVNQLMEELVETFSPAGIAQNMYFIVTLGSGYFKDIIRLRALRVILYKVLFAWNAVERPEDIHIHGISAPWQAENYSPEINMIKSATASMAAVLGGVQSLTVRPADADDNVQVRVARNVSSILREESYFNRTRDALSGAYFVESLTESLARKVWDKIQKT